MTIINNFIETWQQFAEKHEGRLTFVKTPSALGGMGSCQKVISILLLAIVEVLFVKIK